jgi:hypothetical protein
MRAFAYLPPTKCLPPKCFTSGFGAVKLTSTSGLNFDPGPSLGGPDSISQDDGASTEVTGTFVDSRAEMTPGNGSRIEPENEKPRVRRLPFVTATATVMNRTYQRLRQ